MVVKTRLLVTAGVVALLFAGAGVAQAGADKCEQSNGKANGCANHPGEHDDGDGGDGGGDAPSCADLAAVAQELADACDSLVNQEPTEPEPAPVPEPSCADLAAVAQELADGCEAALASIPA